MDWEEQPRAEDPMEVEGGGEEEQGPDEEEDDEMNVDDMPVTQEDAWAVIRYGRNDARETERGEDRSSGPTKTRGLTFRSSCTTTRSAHCFFSLSLSQQCLL